MTTHNISVIIPTFNRPEFLLTTINEVLKQNHSAVCEIIVIDQTPINSYNLEFLERLTLIQENKLVRYIHKSNPSVTEAKDHGILVSNGTILLFLDDDVLLPANYIEEHLKCYNMPEVLAVTGEVYNRDDEYSIADLRIEEPLYGTTRVFNKQFSTSHKKHLAGGNFSVYKELAIQSGGYDERIVSLGEDPDFSYRLMKQFPGKLVIFNPDAFIIHLRAPFGGNRISGNQLIPEYKHFTGHFLVQLRYEHRSIINVLISGLRLGPLRKENVIHPWRQPYAWYSYFKAMVLALKNKNKIKTPFKVGISR
jgi:GT2 family glycosyltransferase